MIKARKGHGTVLDDLTKVKKEESDGMREARAERDGGEREKEEMRGRETDEEKVKKAGERGGEKRQGDAPQVTRVPNERLTWKKPSEARPSARGKSPNV